MALRREITTKSCDTYKAEIYMAGDKSKARFHLQLMAAEKGMCASVESVDYVYTGGMESGFVVRLINYPRFQSDPKSIKDFAIRIAESLLKGLGQGSCSVVCSDETFFMSRRKDD